ncbi:MAG TPA: tetratricopeptide repeat protein [Allosphingosinicella sp.]|nr:tetratricopeptide repeat protein [Allosphingosinicella sp.]
MRTFPYPIRLIAAAMALIGPPALAAQPAAPAAARTAAQPSIAELRAQAAAGDAGAQLDLGLRIFSDPASHAEARTLFQRAMRAGNAEAKSNYALMLMMGWGGPADVEQGRRLRAEAAAEGSMAANVTLAMRYLGGEEGYPRDPALAFRHMQVVANSSTPSAPNAQWRLGMMHLQGIGTPASEQEAWRWVVRASEAGDTEGMVSRAVMLAIGQGVAENDAEARLWYRRAAESRRDGFGNGLRGLGWMLATGEGGPIDLPTGIAYLMLASDARANLADQFLERLRPQITPEIDRRAREIGQRWASEHWPR